MANCDYCELPVGLLQHRHASCNEAFLKGETLAEIRARVRSSSPAAAPAEQVVSVKMGNVMWAVFFGMWLFAITAAIVYAVIRAVT